MMYSVVTLSPATSTENLQALEEVKDFCTTDLGRGGKQRWTYHILPESAVDSELQRLCDPCSSKTVDSVTFQPCSEYANLNQDRYSVEEWDLHGGIWHFNAVYDGIRPLGDSVDDRANPRWIGHCGHDTVNFVCRRLPLMIRTSLQSLVSSSAGTVPSSELVSQALTSAIRRLDASIRSDLFDFLPCDRLCRLSSDQLGEHIQRHESKWETISARCTQGATVIFSLLDPSKRRLWIVNLGDSQAGEPLLHASKTSFAPLLAALRDDSACQEIAIWRMVRIRRERTAQRQQPAGKSAYQARARGRTRVRLRQQGDRLPCTHTR